MKWLILLGLGLCLNAQSGDPARWVGVGHLTDDIVMYYSIRADDALSYLDAAVLVKLDPNTKRTEPDGYHPGGGAELGSHSIFYDERTRTVSVDGLRLLRLDAENVVLLAEALEPGQQPKTIGMVSALQPIPNEGVVMNQDVRELLLSQPAIRAYAPSR